MMIVMGKVIVKKMSEHRLPSMLHKSTYTTTVYES